MLIVVVQNYLSMEAGGMGLSLYYVQQQQQQQQRSALSDM
jgi:hypothetical protein